MEVPGAGWDDGEEQDTVEDQELAGMIERNRELWEDQELAGMIAKRTLFPPN